MGQNHSFTDFGAMGAGSWVILSEIEQSIKRKIESVGTPLKDWDIQINYGIKTGYNEAFIITTEKRNHILSNCQSEEERKKTEDFSKPKIIWKRVGSILRFCYNDNVALGLDSTCFATGTNIEFICCVLNSPMGHYLLKDAPKTGTGDLLISVQAVDPIMIPIIGNTRNLEFGKALKQLIDNNNTDVENELSQEVFDLYGLSANEQLYIIENFS